MIYTIGHSTRSIEEFIDLLMSFGIKMVADVRTVPKSRHNPQFNADALEEALKEAGIRYCRLEKLGGLRHAAKDSLNLGWRNLSFRGFADYMQTSPFWEGIEELEALAKKNKCAILCAEAVPWRCHRSLIADALKLRKWKVLHILNKKIAKSHQLTSFLKVKHGMLLYPS
jgi:uncharacterized protein (DUF488 family)